MQRQLPENFRQGDRTSIPLQVSGEIAQLESADPELWMLTLRVGSLTTVRQDYRKESQKGTRKQADPVLWSVTPKGDLELVVRVGARQRLPVAGISSRKKAALCSDLRSLAPEELRRLLQELATAGNVGSTSGGAPINGKQGPAEDSESNEAAV